MALAFVYIFTSCSTDSSFSSEEFNNSIVELNSEKSLIQFSDANLNVTIL